MKEKWYKNGIYFKCQKCSKCCTKEPGYVWIFEEDIEKISKFLKIKKDSFLKKYTLKTQNKISLKEISPSYDCIFLKDKKCRIYKVRPIQCRTYPFWKKNLESKDTFDLLVKKNCPGANSKEKKYSKEDIENLFIKFKKNI